VAAKAMASFAIADHEMAAGLFEEIEAEIFCAHRGFELVRAVRSEQAA
jgi:hypothetical protein